MSRCDRSDREPLGLTITEAAEGLGVTSKSRAGIERLEHRASERGLGLRAEVADLRDYRPRGSFELVITHGVLHLLEKEVGDRLITEMKGVTVPGGWNVHVVFTDRLPQPDDLAPFVLHPFEEGELASHYEDWEIELRRSYVHDDEHPGGVRHRHALDKVVARRPGYSLAACR